MLCFELRDNRPIFFRHERGDLTLSLDDHAQGNGLDASGGNTSADLVPKQRAYLVADKPIENAARLLRVNNVFVDAPRLLHGCANRFRGDFIEENAKDFGLVSIENFLEVLADRFTFTIGVGCEKNAIGALRCSAEFLDDLLFAGNDFVDRFEIVLDIDAQFALGQIFHMAERGFNDKFLAQIFIYRVCFCG